METSGQITGMEPSLAARVSGVQYVAEINVIPEERFAKIESILQTTAEKQAIVQEQQARQQAQLGTFGQEIEKQNEEIRSLIVVARACLDSIKRWEKGTTPITGNCWSLKPSPMRSCTS